MFFIKEWLLCSLPQTSLLWSRQLHLVHLPVQSYRLVLHLSLLLLFLLFQHQQHPMVTRSKARIVKPNPSYALLTKKVSIPQPRTLAEALNHAGWIGAMGEEFDSCKETNTFTLVPRTDDMHVLGNHWVHRVKLNADGSFKKLRSRLVAKANEQEEGIDFLETYSPMVRMASVRTILNMATVLNWDIRQMDIKNAFLHGDLQEIVFTK